MLRLDCHASSTDGSTKRMWAAFKLPPVTGTIPKPEGGSLPQQLAMACECAKWVGVYSSGVGPFPYCGGTLIAPKWVLTAAHCILDALKCKNAPYGQLFSYREVTGEDMLVTVADHNYTQHQRPTYNVRVKGVIMHPFVTEDSSSAGFDIALLQLNRAVKRSTPEHCFAL